MKQDVLLQALSEVDQGLVAFPGWGQIKAIARAYPIELEEGQLSPGQLAVMVMWRIFSVDSEGKSNAPDFEEVSAEVIRASLEVFKASLAEEVLQGGELDLDSIKSLFQMAQKIGAA
jgi:hypothetical protein